MKDVSVRSSPDPVVGGQAFTLYLSGNLDVDVTEGFLDVDMNVEALGLINKPVKGTTHFKYTPGVAKGPFVLTIGPVKFPWLPGTNKLSGSIKLSDASKAPIGCLGLNLALMEEPAPGNMSADPVVSCTSSSAHMKNVAFASTDDGSTITGDLDESITQFTIKVDTKVTVGWFPVPITLDAPVKWTPGFSKGPFKLETTKTALQTKPDKLGTELTGNIKVNDQNGEEVVCLKLDAPLADTVVV